MDDGSINNILKVILMSIVDRIVSHGFNNWALLLTMNLKSTRGFIIYVQKQQNCSSSPFLQ